MSKVGRRARHVLRACLASGAVAFGVLAYVYVTLPDVRPLASTNPTTTAFMELRAREAQDAGRRVRKLHRWVPYSRISQNLKRAVLVAEDDAFWDHEGVDFEQIRRSIEVNLQRGAAVRGASTLTQQLAKNLYLSPSRDPLRKLRELIIARRLEAELPKARIFEIYLNVIEWGDGVWGADAAARHYFGVGAGGLGASQAALLAGAIINPRVLNPRQPSARLVRRQRMLLARMHRVTPPPPPPVPAVPPAVPAAVDEDVGEAEEQQLPAPVEEPVAPVIPPAEEPSVSDPPSTGSELRESS